MSTRLTNEEYLTYVRDNEDDIVQGLSSVDLKLFIKKLCHRANIAYSIFSPLESENIDKQAFIRYVLRVLCENLKSEVSTWDSFVQVVSSLDGCSVQLVEKLRNFNVKKYEVMTNQNFMEGDSMQDITIKSEDANLLADLLVSASPKWKNIAVSLGLKEHEKENCKTDDIKLCLYNVIACWLTNHSNTTLTRLQESLASSVVGERNLSLQIKEKFKQAKLSQEDSLTSPSQHISVSATYLMNPVITGMSNTSIEVAEGKSTLLLVEASPKKLVSYQWKKNEIAIEDSSYYSGVHSDMLVISKACRGTEGEYTCCVTYQEKEVCSEKIVLKVQFSIGKKQLLDLYLSKKEIPHSHDTWPPKVSNEFIHLALITSPEDSKYCKDLSVRGDIDDITAKKRRVEYEEVFNDYRNELIMIEGRPGSGKTTLVHKIVKDWANGETLIGAQLVFLVVLRELSNTQVNSLSDLLEAVYFDKELSSVYQSIQVSNGEKLVFVIDGLDEYRCQDKKNDVIFQLLDKKLLPLAMIVVSSRPSASKSVREDVFSKRIEIVGFSENEIMEYIDHFPFSSSSSECSNTTSSQSVQDSLKEYLHSHPNVMDMCYLPVHSAMICYLYDSESVSQLSTQTSIYEEFTRSLILRHLRIKNPQIRLNFLQELKGEFQEYFSNICKLAYCMTVNSNQIITSDEVASYLGCRETFNDSNCLGLLTIYHEIKNTGYTKIFSFLHLTLQEFLAAYYIACLSPSRQIKIFKEFTDLKEMKTVWVFYCGLISFQPGMKQLKEVFFRKNYIWLPDYGESRLKYTFESQSQVVCDRFTEQVNGCFVLRCSSLSPSNLLALSYVICNTTMPVRQLYIGELFNDENKINILFQNLSKKRLYQFENISIDTPISMEGIDYLIHVLKSSKSLKYLNITLKNVSVEQCLILVDCLIHLNDLNSVKLTLSSAPGSIETLLKALSNYSFLFNFSISFKDITDKGVESIARGLTSDIRLQELSFINTRVRHEDLTSATSESDDANSTTTCQSMNTITSEGAASLSSSLKYLKCLSNLDLSHNDIGIEGVASLSCSFHFLTKLSILRLSHNKIGSEGAAYLASSFQYLTGLTKLDISHNTIGPEGAIRLSSSLQYLTELVGLDLSHNIIGLEGTISLFNSLHYFTKLMELDLSHNLIGSDRASSLSISCHYITGVKGLNLSHNKINSEGSICLLHSFQYFTGLKNLDLSHNIISSGETTTLSNSFQCLSELYYLNLSHNMIGSEGVNSLSISFQYPSALENLDLSHNMIGSEGVIRLSSSFQHISEVRNLNLSHNNIGYEGIQHLARNLSFLTHLTFLDVSYNDIDLDKALLILSNLRECHELETAYISQSAYSRSWDIIVVHDIVARDDVSAIEKLKEVVRCKKRKRTLDLGFEVLEILPSELYHKIRVSILSRAFS